MPQRPTSPLVPTASLSKRLQVAYGEWRQRRARKFARELDRQVDGYSGDIAYCQRLIKKYNQMRRAPDADPPLPSRLLSHVPEWAQSLQFPDDISSEGFDLETIRAMPRLQAALANCTAYSPSKWLLEQELAHRFSNRTVADAAGFYADYQEKPLQAASQAELQEETESLTESALNPRAWLLRQELSRRAEGTSWTFPETAEELRQSYPDVTGESSSWTDRQWLFERELAIRTADRIASEQPAPDPRDSDNVIDRFDGWSEGAVSWQPENAFEKDVYEVAADEQLAGLCLSGGGIRSATFCLGILQALAARDLLKNFDYLSSVSGGGYIHQWLAAWIHREPRGLASVQQKMIPVPSANSLARAPEQINWLRRYSSYLTPQRGLFTADSWTMLAIWFRNTFLNQIILFSFFAVILVLMRAIMHPFTMPAFHDLHGPLTLAILVNQVWQWTFAIATIICLLWAAWGVVALGRALASLTSKPLEGAQPPRGAIGDAQVVLLIVAPAFLLSILLALAASGIFRVHDLAITSFHRLHFQYASYAGTVHLLLVVWVAYVAALLASITIGGRAMETSERTHRMGSAARRLFGFTITIFVCTLLPTTGLIAGVTHGFRGNSIWIAATNAAHGLDHLLQHELPLGSPDAKPEPDAKPTPDEKPRPEAKPANHNPAEIQQQKHRVPPGALVAIFLPLLFLIAQLLAVRLLVGLLGRAFEESRREWLARYGAWVGILSALWLGLGLITLIGPYVYYWFFDVNLTRRFVSAAVVAIVHAITLYAGSSSKTSGVPDPQRFFGYSLLDLAGIVGAPVAILALLIVTSGWIDIVTNSSFNHVYGAFAGALAGPSAVTASGWLTALRHYQVAVCGPELAFLLYLILLLLFGWRVDVNEFSLHPFYRDRLARCYIGASNGRRVPDPFTGFDDHSEVSYNGIALAELLPARFGGKPKINDTRPAYDGPMPIFCSTVNLTFGEDLAFQDRKGASFAFTPLYTGYHITWTAEADAGFTTTYNGFVPTVDYAYQSQSLGLVNTATSGIPLTTCAAISGAALSPNQGYSSQPTLAFLMTLFNARLGWWIANPRKPWIWPNELDQPTPRFGLRYLLSELFGYSDDTSNYVSLSDGGRFDNMGLYELVRRRCRKIVICDGEEDDNTTFEGLGLAVTKARIDFGVEIEFAPGELDALAPDPKTGRSSSHFATATIRYPAPPGGDNDDPKYMGQILYLKTAFVGDEPADLLHYKRERPDFPQETTLNQWFTEPQFESYRRLGQLTAELAFQKIPW